MAQHFKGEDNAYISGQPGTTGREPFENSTASGPGANFVAGGLTGEHSGQHNLGQSGLTGDHQHHQHGEHHGEHGLGQSGLKGETRAEHQHGTGLSAGSGVSGTLDT